MPLLASLLAVAAGHRPTLLASFGENKDASTTFSRFGDLPKQYHTYERLLGDVRALASECSDNGVDLSLSSQDDGPVKLDIVHLKTSAGASGPHFKVGAAFGEHSRELISPETALVAIRAICTAKGPACDDCGEHQSLLEAGAKVRSTATEWSIVLNANPLTRAKLEKTGDFCLRLDPDGVDPNRNYEAHFEPTGDHGMHAFSQPETRALAKILSDFQPNAYFSIHSGQLGLYGPHAWNTNDPDPDYQEFKVLDEVKALCPDCPVGPAGKLQGRPLTGSSFDYARDVLKSDYSYAFEVFIDPDNSPSSPNGCFRYFNPATSESYEEVTSRFATVFLQTAHLSHQHSLAMVGDTVAEADEAAISASNMRSSLHENPAEPWFSERAL